MLTASDQVVLGVLEAVEIACRKASGAPDPAAAIADALATHRAILLEVLGHDRG